MSLQSLNNQHRAAIIAKDVQLANQIAAKYHPVWSSLLRQLQKLLHDMQAAEQAANDAGTPFHAQVWLLQFHRLDGLLASVKDDIGSFADTARDLVQQQLRTAWAMGEDHALAQLRSELGSLGFTFGVPSPKAVDILLQRAVAKDDVAARFSKMDTQTTELVRKRIIVGVALGQGPRTIAADMARALNIPLNRALTIARTESISAYRDAALDTYRANRDVVEGWTWSAASGACPQCSEKDGKRFDLDVSMDSHPNCRCACLPDTKSYNQILSEVA